MCGMQVPDFKYLHLKITIYVYWIPVLKSVLRARVRFLNMYSYLIYASRVRYQFNCGQKYLN